MSNKFKCELINLWPAIYCLTGIAFLLIPPIDGLSCKLFLPLDEAIASRAVFIIVSGRTGGQTDGRKRF